MIDAGSDPSLAKARISIRSTASAVLMCAVVACGAGDLSSTTGGAARCGAKQCVLTGEVPNARDLGGTPLEAGGSVAFGRIYRGSELAELSEAGCVAVADLRLRTVIDLRTPVEISAAPESSCVADEATIVLAPMPTPYNLSPDDYLADLAATDSVRAAFEALGEEASYPVYIHCVYGRDRTGVLAAVILLALGAKRDTAFEEYLFSKVAGFGAYPESLEAVLDEIDLGGGVGAYLESAGIPAETVETLRFEAIAGSAGSSP